MPLAPKDVDFFVARGYLVLRGCLDEEKRREWVARAFRRLGYEPGDPKTWAKTESQLPGEMSLPAAELAPAAWEACVELCGGRGRIEEPDRHEWSDCFSASFRAEGPEVLAPSREGSWSMPLLGNADAGLLVWVNWQGAGPKQTAMVVAADSVGPAARALGAARYSTGEVLAECETFDELKLSDGDVVLLHPLAHFIEAPAPLKKMRLSTMRSVDLDEPPRLDQPEISASPIERAVLRAAGKGARLSMAAPGACEQPAGPSRSSCAARRAPAGFSRPSCVKSLSDEQLSHFLERGYLALKHAIPRQTAFEWTERAAKRLDCDPREPKTWTKEMIWLPATAGTAVKELSPAAFAAICDLTGGADRLAEGARLLWPDAFVVNFFSKKPWQPPGASRLERWHLDAPDGARYLDCGQPGLICFILWSDVAPKGGGTFIASDSIGHVSRHLAAHPEGVAKREIPAGPQWFSDFVELSGDAGDVFLLHPFMMHTDSRNASGRPRWMTARAVDLKEPLKLDRPRAEDYSPVELAVLAGAGKERLDFKRRS